MSSLLEKAIIDAKALKEAALKNAENLVIEKYSNEVDAAVARLLEQEDPFADLGMGTEDDTSGADPMAATPTEDPAGEEDAVQDFADSFIGSIPDGFDPDLEDPDDEIVNIKLDSIRQELPDEGVGVFGGDDEFSDDEIGIDITDEDDFEDDLEDDFDFDDDIGIDIQDTPDFDADVDVDITQDQLAEAIRDFIYEDEDLEEDIDEGNYLDEDDMLEEMELDEEESIEEAVRVDFEPQKSGWAGTPESIMREYEQMLLAREQDSKVKEENEELRKTVAALQKENKTLASAAIKLETQNDKYTTTLEALQEKLETTNVSNAKLLYINRALENTSLNERQKEKIVESISKATTVQEARIVFETLQETVTSSPAEKKSGTLSEAVSRRSTLLVGARKEQKQKAVNPLYNRMQKLAGITK